MTQEKNGTATEAAVMLRYSQGVQNVEAALCCPTSIADSGYLAIIPEEIRNVDYGCGDPSQHARPGDTVVDLGSGSGKACYVMAQKVGPAGAVIGVDLNDDMLALARKYQALMAERMGHANVRFVKARIQDLALDMERVDAWLADNPVRSTADLSILEDYSHGLRRREPLIADGEADLVVSNCVLNLVRTEDKERLFDEIFRVLRNGGRAVISDIVCNREPGPEMRTDPELWSGCISGAFREDTFMQMFIRAGFSYVELLARQAEPWRVIDGIEFRSLTVRAARGLQAADDLDAGSCDPGSCC